MNTAEKVQVTALAAIFLFLSYITVYTVQQTLEMNSRVPRVTMPKGVPRQTQAPVPEGKGAKKEAHKAKQTPKELFSQGKRKVADGDCEGALKDLDAAAHLDTTLKDQISTALDSCKKK